MPTVLPLSKLVDLALGTPEVGAVNFNVLHTLLHAMISKLNLSDAKAAINESDRDFLSSSKPQRIMTALSDIDSGKGEDSEDAMSEIRDASETDTPVSSATHKSRRSVPYHHLELRVEKLAEQLESLNALPSNADLFERAKAKGDGERPVADMWQYMQLKKRVDTNEDGVGKLMSLVEDLMKEMQTLRDANADLMNKINGLNIDELNKKLADLEKMTNDLNNKFSTLPTPDEWSQFVTWPLLEDALKGVRTDMEGLQAAAPERVVMENSSQTDVKTPSRPPSAQPSPSRPTSSRPLSRMSVCSSGPTNDLLDVLERLGKLSDDHESLAKRVQELEEQMKNKVDKEALENLTQELAALSEKQQDHQPVVVTVAQPSVERREVISVWTQTPPETPKPSSPVPESLPPPPKSPTPPPKSLTPPLKSNSPPPKSPSPPPKSPSPQTALSVQEAPTDPDPTETTPSPPVEAVAAATPPVVFSESVDPQEIDQVLVHLLESDLSSDLLDQLNKLKEDLDALQAMRDKDSDALSRAQKAILQLQAELERLQNTTENIITENNHRSKQIESLLTYCDTLQEKKADKEYVAMEVDVKADKRQLDNKVNHSLFDSTTGEINKIIKDILDKLDGNDSGWKEAYKQLAEDVDGKLDRLEIDPLKEWLESRLKALNKKIMANANNEWGDDDAAGLRKQLLQRFNCLSCDRPVDLMPTGPVPSLPSQNGLPATRSPRPYTTFELEQIRQHAKNFSSQEVSDYYATMRQCGGSHTLTYPHKRVSRMTQMNNLFKEEGEEPREPVAAVFPIYKEEVDVQGVDGHIYRGRMERVQIEAKMPSKMAGGQPTQAPKSPATSQRVVKKVPQTESVPIRGTPTPPLSSRNRPMSARGIVSPRPGSGRPMSRPQSRPMSARHSGQESSRTTPFPDESYMPQDLADQGQTTVEAEAIRVDVPTPDILDDQTEE